MSIFANLDMEGFLRRFVNKNRVDLNDNSLRTYQQRFKQTVEMYLKFIDGEPDWNTVKGRSGSARPAATTKTAKSSKSGNVVEMKPGSSDTPSDTDTSAVGWISWDIPVRPGVKGKLVLPDRMSRHEAAKVVTMMTSLAQGVEEQLALTQRPSES